MHEEVDFQRWIQQASRTTKERIEITSLANSRFVKDQYGRRITPLPQLCLLADYQNDKSILDPELDESDATGFVEEYKYIFSWRPEDSDSLPAMERRSSPERKWASDRNLLASQRSRSSMRNGLTERTGNITGGTRDKTSDTRSVDDAASEGPFLQPQPSQSGSLKRKAAIRRKSTRPSRTLEQFESSRSGGRPRAEEAMHFPIAPVATQSQSPYRTVIDTNDEIFTTIPSWVTRADGRPLQTDRDEMQLLPIELNSAALFVEISIAKDEPCGKFGTHGQGKSQFNHSQNKGVEGKNLDRNRPRIARTFSQMGIGKVVLTALKDE
ncbi:hypothetical protein NX059_006339 [Plenodomus lindquistii]|nr:hypothetical protein NX059_006339 [Plenodomus lindquistii]